MPELSVLAPMGSGGTASAKISRIGHWGNLPLEDLQSASLVISDGPTGASRYWPEWFSCVHPDFATTDVGYNRVDEVWIPRASIRVSVVVQPWTSPLEPLSDVLRAMRVHSGMSAADVAAMVGLRRRQLYNLLDGLHDSPHREAWIRRVAAAVVTLHHAATGSAQLVRAALLHPVRDGQSPFDLACAQRDDDFAAACDVLAEQLKENRISARLQRPSPSLRRRGTSRSASEFLAGYREPDEDG
ncbi:helix-turn-helix transcriptional regulator [Conexibacter stalactiti]|uniref:Helix-turn-helix transcriptional regulator n=1 Tax=Conexibacter stalactiti TaxID=1940611 RepID=A0ABU4HP81_9ACTN|nr:helix-turn-helix transcriptional regulator [Conexibacter stalactiti]MDW5595108.1 helix-turn-helix transcriptional regulator [Conexibacter stalactiti]MEC5035750.1 helix-turn-helix transcriptional regulator [Conexibacter stalactiti]